MFISLFILHPSTLYLIHIKFVHDQAIMASYSNETPPMNMVSSRPPSEYRIAPPGVKRERENATRTPKKQLHLARESRFLANRASYAPRMFLRTVFPSSHMPMTTTISTPPTYASSASASTSASGLRPKTTRESAARNVQSRSESPRSASLRQVGLTRSMLQIYFEI